MIDRLFKLVRKGFSQIADHRSSTGNTQYKLVNLLSIGFAMFSLKDSSLAMFRKEYPARAGNLERIYGLTELPGDTALREGLDGVDSKLLQAEFKAPLKELRNKLVFKERQVLGGYLAISCDGTGHYCSGKKGCPQCLVKNHKSGKQTFYHQLLAAVQVHPEQKTVFPVAVEPIVQQDGSTKNDCELNASKRLLPQIRQMLPREKLLGLFDALYANGPHILELNKIHMSYIIGIKDGYVLVQAKRLREQGALEQVTWEENGVQHTINYANGLVLNGVYRNLLVNYFDYKQVDLQTGKTIYYHSWITDIPITQENIKELVSVARSRWKVENETFNTLKNQGYHLEHNYGHGKEFLASNFAMLAMLAFLIDQIAQHLDTAFQKAWKVRETKKALWKKVRQVFDLLPVVSMNAIYRFIIGDIIVEFPLLE